MSPRARCPFYTKFSGRFSTMMFWLFIQWDCSVSWNSFVTSSPSSWALVSGQGQWQIHSLLNALEVSQLVLWEIISISGHDATLSIIVIAQSIIFCSESSFFGLFCLFGTQLRMFTTVWFCWRRLLSMTPCRVCCPSLEVFCRCF